MLYTAAVLPPVAPVSPLPIYIRDYRLNARIVMVLLLLFILALLVGFVVLPLQR